MGGRSRCKLSGCETPLCQLKIPGPGRQKWVCVVMLRKGGCGGGKEEGFGKLNQGEGGCKRDLCVCVSE